uniref:7TM_GPCR_Srx domain-containing protein n=1 Tax=Caenorhabditis japonica TaxID=281687 RepID=A0A8R1DF84_CAEJA
MTRETVHDLAASRSLTSTLAGAINAYIASGFMFGIRFRGGFFILSVSKSFSNILTCSMMFFWLTPTILANQNLVSSSVNMVLSQLLLFGIYMQSNLTQCFLSINRFSTIGFLGVGKQKNTTLITVLAIFSSWFAAVIWTGLGFPECTCFFSAQTLTFRYLNECHVSNYQFQLYCTFVLNTISNMLNTISFLIIVCGGAKYVSFTCRQPSRRKQRNARMFVQCYLQSLLLLLDVLLISSLHSETFGDILVALPSFAYMALFDGSNCKTHNAILQQRHSTGMCGEKESAQEELGDIDCGQ